MLLSLALIFLLGFAASYLCGRVRLPGIVGMLLVGVVLGPFGLNLLDGVILDASGQLRQMALIIILLKAGLSLNLGDLKRVGRPAVMMSFVPAACEILAFTLFAPSVLGVTRIEAALMGAVIGAVSPAVVIPRTVQLMDRGYGTDKSIPQLILAGASCDDVFVIVLFSTFLSMAQGEKVNFTAFLRIPVSIIVGVLLGAAVGFALSMLFKKAKSMRAIVRAAVTLCAAFIIMAMEDLAADFLPLSGLLGVVSMACVMKIKSPVPVAAGLRDSLGKAWIGAEVLLFVLVGAAVDVSYTAKAGMGAAAMIFISLAIRSVGVLICLLGTKLNKRERLFCVIAYLPKATVQAAIGSVPLSLGLPSGKIILSAAVLAILITAPLGALGMDLSYKKLLRKSPLTQENT